MNYYERLNNYSKLKSNASVDYYELTLNCIELCKVEVATFGA